MQTLSQLTPQPLWQLFEQICAIPHASHHEEALAQHIINWATQRDFFVERDSVGNILIRKSASAGYENLQPVALQAHLDMVPQKNEATQHDFAKDPIQAYIDDGWVKARGTTLGADNGIGMASALAILDDKSVVHGPIEVLLTMTEETGMDGAFGLRPNWLRSQILINTDSETEGEVYMGCAGGIDASISVEVTREPLPEHYSVVKLDLKGLKGGHSGVDIHLGLGNANKLLARYLFSQANALGLRLMTISGGTLRNAIPREATAIVAIASDKLALLEKSCEEYLTTLKNELLAVEKNISFYFKPTQIHELPLSGASQHKLLSLLNGIPNGVIRMSDSIDGVVETSLNVGVVTTLESRVTITCLIRSLIDSGKDYVVEVLNAISTLADATCVVEGGYPGWQPNNQSEIMQLVKETHQKLFNAAPKMMVIHAGLECGLFKKSYPEMDMVSIGPMIRGPHSPDEKVNILSVNRYWQLLVALLQAIPPRK